MANVERIRCRLTAYIWPFATDEAVRIGAHWTDLRAHKPALFDGRVLLGRRLDLADGVLQGEAFEVRYSAFLGWRDFGFPGKPVHNVFAMPALRSSDGAFILGRMSAGTANGGRIYFPAGTPEPRDVGADGTVDFEANILRELEEETGLGPADVALAPDWTIVFAGPLVACMRVAQSPLEAEVLESRIAAFLAQQADPELDGTIAVRDAEALDPDRTPEFMRRYLRMALCGTNPLFTHDTRAAPSRR